jgi:hypothetical protein
MNFIGASSKVAKFIKELSTSVKHSFVSSTDHKTEQKKTKSIKYQIVGMMQIVVEGEAHSKSDYGDQQIAATFF